MRASKKGNTVLTVSHKTYGIGGGAVIAIAAVILGVSAMRPDEPPQVHFGLVQFENPHLIDQAADHYQFACKVNGHPLEVKIDRRGNLSLVDDDDSALNPISIEGSTVKTSTGEIDLQGVVDKLRAEGFVD